MGQPRARVSAEIGFPRAPAVAEVRATLFPPAACEGEVADRFEGGGQIDLGELGAALEGRVADDGEGGGQGDLAEGGAVVEGAIWDGYLCRKQAGSAFPRADPGSGASLGQAAARVDLAGHTAWF